jgi:WD40 repeat protein
VIGVTNVIVQLKVWGLEFSPLTPNYLASGGVDGALLVWDLTIPTAAATFPLTVREVFSLLR